MPPADPEAARRLLLAALADGARASGVAAGDQLVGVALVAPASEAGQPAELLWVGVAPAQRRQAIGTAVLAALVGQTDEPAAFGRLTAQVGIAERDVVDPLPADVRLAIASRMLDRAGVRASPVSSASWARS
jgi:GNAT superfamily N-acetyltransferase